MSATSSDVGDFYVASSVVCRGCGSLVWVVQPALDNHLTACQPLTRDNANRPDRSTQ